MEHFNNDLTNLLNRLTIGEDDSNLKEKLSRVKDKLLELRERNLVKINHSVMELLCAKYLIRNAYSVDIEYPLNDILTCDLYGVKGDGTLILEVETGFTPPEHALDPLLYNKARIISKIARYSALANKFILGTPLTNILQISPLFLKPPRYREKEDILILKNLCDRYYTNPPIGTDEIRNGRLYTIFLIDIDNFEAREIDLEIYLEKTHEYMNLTQ